MGNGDNGKSYLMVKLPTARRAKLKEACKAQGLSMNKALNILAVDVIRGRIAFRQKSVIKNEHHQSHSG
jgi:hypothetical protein